MSGPARRFLGRGWAFPVLPDASGRLRYTSGAQNIEHSLKVLLLTQLGERVMRPGLGTDTRRMVFAPGSLRHLRLLETSVRRAIVEHERRVDVLEVRAEADPTDRTRVVISIDYRVRRTNAVANLVFPYYLQEGESL